MIFFVKGLMFASFLFINYFFERIYVNQYYSFTRFIKVIDSKIKRIGLISCVLIFINLPFFYKYFSYIVSILLIFLYTISIKYYNLTLTRRNITYFFLSASIFLIIILFIDIRLVLSLFFGFYFLVFFLANLILLPIENMIRNYYYKKAKKRLLELKPYIIGITGSFGKTTTRMMLKDLLATKYRVITPNGNINTPSGIAKFINNTSFANIDILILELGIDRINSMKVFKKFIDLDIGIITNIGKMHLATFKSIDNIYKEKIKIQEMVKDKILYLNKDCEYLDKIHPFKTCFFSKSMINNYSSNLSGTKFKYEGKEYYSKVYNPFYKSYFSLAILIGKRLGLSNQQLKEGISSIHQVDNRFSMIKKNGKIIIKDNYNNNFQGAKEDIDYLKKLPGISIVITSGLIELGDEYETINQKLGDYINPLKTIFIGKKDHPLVKSLKNAIIVSSFIEAENYINLFDFDNILILSKGDNLYVK